MVSRWLQVSVRLVSPHFFAVLDDAMISRSQDKHPVSL
jgi:hypothetical protein